LAISENRKDTLHITLYEKHGVSPAFVHMLLNLVLFQCLQYCEQKNITKQVSHFEMMLHTSLQVSHTKKTILSQCIHRNDSLKSSHFISIEFVDAELNGVVDSLIVVNRFKRLFFVWTIFHLRYQREVLEICSCLPPFSLTAPSFA
jgi:hypothetical protein